MNEPIPEAAIEDLSATPGRSRARRLLWLGAACLALGALALVTWRWWTFGRHFEVTDDAYVGADISAVSSRISGFVVDVAVDDNQPVSAGQVLVRIDDRDFRARVAELRAELDAAQAATAHLDAQLALQDSVIRERKAAFSASEASLELARADATRFHNLALAGASSQQSSQQASASLAVAVAALDRDSAAFAGARQQTTVLSAERAQARAKADSCRAALELAELNLSYTTIAAPIGGVVGARSVRVGTYVQAGTALLAVVPLDSVYVVANYKETQLANVRDGAAVELTVDSLPGLRFSGRVDSLAPASGLEFALLPPDNATGNFTKIVQRIPVKIRLDDDSAAGRLRPGMSVESRVDTRPSEDHPGVAQHRATAGPTHRIAGIPGPASVGLGAVVAP